MGVLRDHLQAIDGKLERSKRSFDRRRWSDEAEVVADKEVICEARLSACIGDVRLHMRLDVPVKYRNQAKE